MRPLELTMQSFGSYGEKTVIDFTNITQSLFLITGNTGSGKTTVFDAIVFALYGETGSSFNKKEGALLQSHYAPPEREPFVELKFTEGARAREVYTVRRVPRHVRPLTRGSAKGVGLREIAGSVSLLLPDGTEYPAKETDQKLEELLGLTKSQFMQVVMIAQGEFMELLRAKSDDKKEIFRKLFHTGLYQRITEELGGRRKKSYMEMERQKAECRAQAERVQTREEPALADLNAQKERVEAGELSAVPSFLEALGEFCSSLKEELEQARRACAQAEEERDRKRDACTAAENLLLFFQQEKEAGDELEDCRQREEEIGRMQTLEKNLRFAYEIRTEYGNLQKAEKSLAETKTALAGWTEALPDLIKKKEEALSRETTEQALLKTETETYNRLSEKVETAARLFQETEALQKKISEQKTELENANRELEDRKSALVALEKETEEKRTRQEALLGLATERALLEGKKKELNALFAEAKEAQVRQTEAKTQREKAKEKQLAYAGIRKACRIKKEEYDRIRLRFLDAQAGYLAKELKPGNPCPVCGSLEHPHPCAFGEAKDAPSREKLESLKKESDALSEKQEAASTAAGICAKLAAEKETAAEDILAKLCEKCRALEEPGQYGKEARTLPAIQKLLAEKENELLEQEETLLEQEKEQQGIHDFLQDAGGEKQKRLIESERWQKTAFALETEIGALLAKCEAMKAQAEFQTREEARRALEEAKKKKAFRQQAYNEAKAQALRAKEESDRARTLMESYTQKLPALKEACAQSQKTYEACMEERSLSETVWKELTETHLLAETEELREKIQRHFRRKEAAEKLLSFAKRAIAGREKPIPEKIRQEKEEAEEKYKEARTALEQSTNLFCANDAAYRALAEKEPERKRLLEEYARLAMLYRLASGNVTDGRMDLETYVQRYYLEQILHSANRRFYEMSAGQYELRMVSAGQAGKGKNRGLDLMVYSMVTGKEREVRTLSGGESFMAALSLALGMADQIQQSAPAISLDVMFIDEGFGSLDDYARTQAVKVLQGLGSTRLIGIISHVTELKQEIGSQLIVEKDETGSHVRWQIN